VAAFGVLFSRFTWLQVLQYEHFMTAAQNNRISLVPIPPNRGVIYDRNGIVLAQNYSAYTLEITPSQTPNLEHTLNELAKLIAIEPRDRKRFRKLQEESRNFESCQSAPVSPMKKWHALPPKPIGFPGWKLKRVCSVIIPTAKSPAM